VVPKKAFLFWLPSHPTLILCYDVIIGLDDFSQVNSKGIRQEQIPTHT